MRQCGIAGALGLTLAVTAIGTAQASAPALSPILFQQLSSGVAYIRTYGCGGKPIAQGSGFLIGDSVVMTARHVLAGSCRASVKVAGKHFSVTRWVYWTEGHDRGTVEDVATLKLDGAAPGHKFEFRPSPPPAGTNLAMLGYPLGNRISLNQGKIVGRKRVKSVPLIAVQMLGAEGASGSAFVDDAGRVVGILQQGLGSKDIFGQRTAGVLVGIDLSSWWGAGARRDLCHAYPQGGIAGCGSSGEKPTPAPPTPPPPAELAVNDPQGDSGAAPDVTTVNVSNDAGGVITIKVLLGNRSALAPTDIIGVEINADESAGTGDPSGGDYLAGLTASGAALLKWDGAHFGGFEHGAVTGSASGGVATLTLSAADLGNTRAFSLTVITGLNGGSDSDMDIAPDGGAWSYAIR